MSYVLMSLVAQRAVAAESCTKAFPHAIQSHEAGGEISFGFRSQIVKPISASLPFSVVYSRFNSDSCGKKTACRASGAVAESIDVDYFLTPESTKSFYSGFLKSKVIGEDRVSQYDSVVVGSLGELRFSPRNTVYRINHLAADYGSVLRLAPGDYWIGSLRLGSGVSIEVVGNGSVRLFVNSAVTVPFETYLNTPDAKKAGNSSRLFLWVNGDITLNSLAAISGIVYARGDLRLDYLSRIDGQASARHVRLGAESQIVSPPKGD